MSDALLDPQQNLDDRSRIGPSANNGRSLRPALNASAQLNDRMMRDAKIMVVDDEPVIIKVVRKYLQDAGCQNIVATSDATKAIGIIRGERPNLVLLDIKMPELDGLEILDRMRNDVQLKDVAVVMLTVASNVKTRLEAFGRGATDFLAKPVDASELVLRVRNVLAAQAHQEQHSSKPADREPRFSIVDRDTVNVFLESTIDGKRTSVPAEILDLSVHGIRLSAEASLSKGDSIDITIQAARLGLDLTISAEVRWLQPRTENKNVFGCCFLVELPNDTLSVLASTGCLERRLEKRKEICLDATARQELNGKGTLPLRILDYTSGGLRLFCHEPKKLGERLLLELQEGENDPICIPLRALWQRQMDDGYHVGCSFLNHKGYGLLQRVLQTNSLMQPAKIVLQKVVQRSLRLSSVWWLGLMVVFSWFAIRALGNLEFISNWWQRYIF